MAQPQKVPTAHKKTNDLGRAKFNQFSVYVTIEQKNELLLSESNVNRAETVEIMGFVRGWNIFL